MAVTQVPLLSQLPHNGTRPIVTNNNRISLRCLVGKYVSLKAPS